MNKVELRLFDRSKAFYPIVMSYLFQLFGSREAIIQGLLRPEKLNARMERLIENLVSKSHESKANLSFLKENLSNICGPLQLKSLQYENHIEIDIDLITKEALNNHQYLLSYMLLFAGQLLILAYELMKEIAEIDKKPICEFLRHCRNAAAHGGKFNFLNGEPKNKAEWGRFKIVTSLQDKPLFRRPDGKGMLGLGDPIRLLWDIEQTYPNLIPSERIYEYLQEKKP